MTIYTIGHSKLELDEFVELLTSHGIKLVADVRRFAGSKKFPHFNREALQDALAERGIKYRWFGDLLGGYRSGGYEAFTESMAFQRGLRQLLGAASRQRTTLMCAEGAWFRCHRRYIADELVKRNHTVRHISSKTSASLHPTATTHEYGDKSC